MDAAMDRRVSVATGWASTRIAVLDREERYEDSYAITEEFREWITSIGEDVSILEANVMPVPRNLANIAGFSTHTAMTTLLKSKDFIKVYLIVSNFTH